MKNFFVQFAVEVVARDVNQHRAAFGVSDAEGGAQNVGGAFGMGHAQRGFGDRFEQVPGVALLKAVPAHGNAARAGRKDDHGRMGHVGGGHSRDVVGDAGAVLADHHAGAAGKAGVGVFHVAGGLLVAHGYEIDAGGRKEVQHIHKGGTENAAYMVYAFLNQHLCHCFTRGHLGHWGFPPNIIIGCRASLPDALSQQGGRAALLRTDSLGMYQLVPSMHKAFLFDNIMDSSKFMAFAPLQSAKMMRY